MAPPHRAVVAGQPLALKREFVRKILHLGAAVFPVAYSLGVSRGVLESVLAATVAIAFATEAARWASPAGGALFARVFGSLTRGHEEQSITGATWLAVSCLAAVVLLPRSAAVAALWCATVGDPVAAIAGRLWTSVRGLADGGRKTFTGSFACAAASFVGVWLLAGFAPAPAAVIALAAAVAEAMPIALDDNIRVAATAGIVAQLLA